MIQLGALNVLLIIFTTLTRSCVQCSQSIEVATVTTWQVPSHSKNVKLFAKSLSLLDILRRLTRQYSSFKSDIGASVGTRS